jgi:hypothetical protein
MSCHIGPNTEVEQGAVGGQPSQSFEEANFFSFEQGKDRMHNPSHDGGSIWFMLEIKLWLYGRSGGAN